MRCMQLYCYVHIPSQVQLTLYLGLVVAALSSLHTHESKDTADDNDGHNIVSFIAGLILGLFLICLSLVCEIPVAVAQCKSSKIMNHYRFRIVVR